MRRFKTTVVVDDDTEKVEAPLVSFDPNQFSLFPKYKPHLEKMPAPRPNFVTMDKTQLYKDVANEIVEWCNDNTKLEDVIEDIENIFGFASSFSRDGYELANEFERNYYQPDSELVDILSGVWRHLGKAQRKANMEWVKTYEIKPLFQDGDLVKTPKGDFGFVKKYDSDEAKIGVQLGESVDRLYIYDQELCSLKS